MKKQSILFLVVSLLIFSSCDVDSNSGTSQLSSVYVMNEGNFSQSNATVSSYDPETSGSTIKAFENVNGRPFAGYIQSSSIIGNRLYIVSNNPSKIEVVDLKTLSSVGTIQLSSDPSTIVSAGNGKAYVSNLYGNNLTVIDLDSLKETDQTIAVGTQPRDMVNVDGKVFVSNAGGIQTGNVDNTISVIDTQTDAVENTLQVGDKPGKMRVDSSGQIWLICSGLTAYDENFNRAPENDTPGSLYLVDGKSQTVLQSKILDERPADIALDERDSRVFLLSDAVESINMNTFQITDSTFINPDFNTIGFSTSEQLLYAAQSKGLDQDGQAVRYSLQGAVVDSFEVGISPVEFQFVTN